MIKRHYFAIICRNARQIHGIIYSAVTKDSRGRGVKCGADPKGGFLYSKIIPVLL